MSTANRSLVGKLLITKGDVTVSIAIDPCFSHHSPGSNLLLVCASCLADKKCNVEERIIKHVCFGWGDQYCRLKLLKSKCTIDPCFSHHSPGSNLLLVCASCPADKKCNVEERIIKHVCFGWGDQYCRLKLLKSKCTLIYKLSNPI